VPEGGAGLILIEIPSRDARVAEILSDPDRYFADAGARAWICESVHVPLPFDHQPPDPCRARRRPIP
jgi:hypothetical protein